MGNYISIKEFSQMAKVSQQSIYKRMRKEDNPLNKFIKLGEKGKPVISTDALALYDKEKIIIDEAEPPAEKDNKPASNNIVNEVIEILREQLEEERKQKQALQEMLVSKDNQINELLKRLEETTKALDQQQQLCALDKQKILELESGRNNKSLLKKIIG